MCGSDRNSFNMKNSNQRSSPSHSGTNTNTNTNATTNTTTSANANTGSGSTSVTATTSPNISVTSATLATAAKLTTTPSTTSSDKSCKSVLDDPIQRGSTAAFSISKSSAPSSSSKSILDFGADTITSNEELASLMTLRSPSSPSSSPTAPAATTKTTSAFNTQLTPNLNNDHPQFDTEPHTPKRNRNNNLPDNLILTPDRKLHHGRDDNDNEDDEDDDEDSIPLPLSPPKHILKKLTPVSKKSVEMRRRSSNDDKLRHQFRREEILKLKIKKLNNHFSKVLLKTFNAELDKKRENERKQLKLNEKFKTAESNREIANKHKRNIAMATSEFILNNNKKLKSDNYNSNINGRNKFKEDDDYDNADSEILQDNDNNPRIQRGKNDSKTDKDDDAIDGAVEEDNEAEEEEEDEEKLEDDTDDDEYLDLKNVDFKIERKKPSSPRKQTILVNDNLDDIIKYCQNCEILKPLIEMKTFPLDKLTKIIKNTELINKLAKLMDFSLHLNHQYVDRHIPLIKQYLILLHMFIENLQFEERLEKDATSENSKVDNDEKNRGGIISDDLNSKVIPPMTPNSKIVKDYKSLVDYTSSNTNLLSEFEDIPEFKTNLNPHGFNYKKLLYSDFKLYFVDDKYQEFIIYYLFSMFESFWKHLIDYINFGYKDKDYKAKTSANFTDFSNLFLYHRYLHYHRTQLLTLKTVSMFKDELEYLYKIREVSKFESSIDASDKVVLSHYKEFSSFLKKKIKSLNKNYISFKRLNESIVICPVKEKIENKFINIYMNVTINQFKLIKINDFNNNGKLIENPFTKLLKLQFEDSNRLKNKLDLPIVLDTNMLKRFISKKLLHYMKYLRNKTKSLKQQHTKSSKLFKFENELYERIYFFDRKFKTGRNIGFDPSYDYSIRDNHRHHHHHGRYRSSHTHHELSMDFEDYNLNKTNSSTNHDDGINQFMSSSFEFFSATTDSESKIDQLFRFNNMYSYSDTLCLFEDGEDNVTVPMSKLPGENLPVEDYYNDLIAVLIHVLRLVKVYKPATVDSQTSTYEEYRNIYSISDAFVYNDDLKLFTDYDRVKFKLRNNEITINQILNKFVRILIVERKVDKIDLQNIFNFEFEYEKNNFNNFKIDFKFLNKFLTFIKYFCTEVLEKWYSDFFIEVENRDRYYYESDSDFEDEFEDDDDDEDEKEAVVGGINVGKYSLYSRYMNDEINSDHNKHHTEGFNNVFKVFNFLLDEDSIRKNSTSSTVSNSSCHAYSSLLFSEESSDFVINFESSLHRRDQIKSNNETCIKSFDQFLKSFNSYFFLEKDLKDGLGIIATAETTANRRQSSLGDISREFEYEIEESYGFNDSLVLTGDYMLQEEIIELRYKLKSFVFTLSIISNLSVSFNLIRDKIYGNDKNGINRSVINVHYLFEQIYNSLLDNFTKKNIRECEIDFSKFKSFIEKSLVDFNENKDITIEIDSIFTNERLKDILKKTECKKIEIKFNNITKTTNSISLTYLNLIKELLILYRYEFGIINTRNHESIELYKYYKEIYGNYINSSDKKNHTLTISERRINQIKTKLMFGIYKFDSINNTSGGSIALKTLDNLVIDYFDILNTSYNISANSILYE
ncbi:hypothetical protein B5S33_g104 [[Candida] boidinii]|nr:hypothetical protein B5S33_g104 [[Candida] boidinii]